MTSPHVSSSRPAPTRRPHRGGGWASAALAGVTLAAGGCGDDLPPPPVQVAVTLQRTPAGPFAVFPSDAVTFQVKLTNSSGTTETDVPVPQGVGSTALTASINEPTDVTVATIDALGRTIGASSATIQPAPTATVPLRFDLPRIGYADSFGDTRLLAYAVDPSSGALTATATYQVGNGPQNPILNARAGLLYLANGRDNTVSTLKIASDGSLAEVLPRLQTGGNPVVGTMSPDGAAIYFPEYIDNDLITFQVAPTTGLLSELPPRVPGATVPRHIMIDPKGRFAYVSAQGVAELRTYRIDPATHALSELTSARTPSGAGSREGVIHPNGKFLYLASATDNTIWIYQLDPTTGAPTAVGTPVATGTFPLSVTIHPNGTTLYVCNYMANTVTQFTLDPASGALTPVGTPITVPSPRAVLFDPSNSFVYITSFAPQGAIAQYTVDPATGALTATGTSVPAGVNTSFVTFLR